MSMNLNLGFLFKFSKLALKRNSNPSYLEIYYINGNSITLLIFKILHGKTCCNVIFDTLCIFIHKYLQTMCTQIKQLHITGNAQTSSKSIIFLGTFKLCKH